MQRFTFASEDVSVMIQLSISFIHIYAVGSIHQLVVGGLEREEEAEDD